MVLPVVVLVDGVALLVSVSVEEEEDALVAATALEEEDALVAATALGEEEEDALVAALALEEEDKDALVAATALEEEEALVAALEEEDAPLAAWIKVKPSPFMMALKDGSSVPVMVKMKGALVLHASEIVGVVSVGVLLMALVKEKLPSMEVLKERLSPWVMLMMEGAPMVWEEEEELLVVSMDKEDGVSISMPLVVVVDGGVSISMLLVVKGVVSLSMLEVESLLSTLRFHNSVSME